MLPAIELAAAQVIPVEDLPEPMRDDPSTVSEFERAALDERLLVAIHGASSTPVGFALMLVIDGNAHLHELDVHPEHARKGIGAALLRDTIAWAKEREFDELTLTTFRHLAWNAPFYARHGFREFPQASLGPELRRLREEETADGLEPEKRLAMRLDLRGKSHDVAMSTRSDV